MLETSHHIAVICSDEDRALKFYVDKLGFRVEDVELAVDWLNARGIETEPVRTDPYNGGRFTFFHDPDGLPLEVHE